MGKQWKKIIAKRAGDVISADDLTEESVALMTESVTPSEFIQQLMDAGHFLDSAKTLAYSLPRREAVWWACMCARQLESVNSAESEKKALSAAEKWVYDPVDERRTIAFQCAQTSKTNSVGVMCALAAAFSDSNLPVDEDNSIEVDSSSFPGAIFAAIVVAASEAENQALEDRVAELLKVGVEIAQGGSGKMKEQPAG